MDQIEGKINEKESKMDWNGNSKEAKRSWDFCD